MSLLIKVSLLAILQVLAIRALADAAPLQGAMVRFDPERNAETAWTEPDRFEVKARDSLSPRKNGETQ